MSRNTLKFKTENFQKKSLDGPKMRWSRPKLSVSISLPFCTVILKETDMLLNLIHMKKWRQLDGPEGQGQSRMARK